MKRIILFLITNIAVMLVLGIVLKVLGVDRILDAQGSGMNYNALLIYAAVFGMGGAFISLAMSKWSAKRMMGARVIEQSEQRDRGLAGGDGAPTGATGRHRHARGGDLRFA